MTKARFNMDLFAFAVMGLKTQNCPNFGDVERVGRSGTVLDLHIPVPMTLDEGKGRFWGVGSLPDDKRAEMEAELQKRQRAAIAKFLKIVREWLDDYEIVFSQTDVSYGTHDDFPEKGAFLRIKVAGVPAPAQPYRDRAGI